MIMEINSYTKKEIEEFIKKSKPISLADILYYIFKRKKPGIAYVNTKFDGNIVGAEKVYIGKNGIVNGNIESRLLIIEEDGIFNGYHKILQNKI